MQARDILSALRDGQPLPEGALHWFAAGLADGRVSDAQAGAFAMAVVLRGLGPEGRRQLTLAMRDSGDVLRWSGTRPVIDKHSTGGVGDCVSLVLAPALAACGAWVPMISGRGLGHTGGTLDKLEAIPGFQTALSETRLRAVVAEAGCAIVAASDRVAPADRRLYAVRDVTSTVASIDLITASILSKKMAAGLQGLVLDVKIGSGAFMQTMGDARALAQALVQTATEAGCPTAALITDMNQPLANDLGNALEVAAAMRVLCGTDRGRLYSLCCDLGAIALEQAGLVQGAEAAHATLARAIDSGAAAEHFSRMVAAQGGPVGFAETWARHLPEAPVIAELPSPATGHVQAIDGRALGACVVALGGGRLVESDLVDPAVGLGAVVSLGQWVERGQPLLRVHATRVAAAEQALADLPAAFCIGDAPPELPPLVHERLGA